VNRIIAPNFNIINGFFKKFIVNFRYSYSRGKSGDMDQSQWELIKSIVDRALSLSGRKRSTYLTEVRNKYPAISADIIELMECIDESAREYFLQNVWSDQKNMLLSISGELKYVNHDEAYLNKKIGAFLITKIIGRGGMGTVFKASRADGAFQQDVAIKLIKTGLNSDDTVLRFKLEREILAGFQHPNIAHLLDGGVTEDGIPYLVMEYINGVPIDLYCDQNKLTIAERLDLFRDVCSAVQYAHNNLIVHRDLKPGNIYVTENGIVKILDFGIAKLLDPQLSQISCLETLPGQKIWTPQFAAPEQVTGENVIVTTDIYSLGIVLFKILTGTYPYNLEGKNLAEMEDMIKNAAPLQCSQAVKQLKNPETCAINRRTNVKTLQRKFQGDLDAMISKAIRKEPEHRYQSVKELADDISRYKSGSPLIAREGTYRYRTEKFISRHKTRLAAVTSLLIIVTLFAVIYSWKITEERNFAQIERNKLEQVVNFMTGLFESSNPLIVQGREMKVIDLLESGIEKSGSLNNQPEVKARILNVIGNTYLILGDYKQAEELHSQAVVIHENVLGSDDPALAESLNNLAVALTRQGKYKIAADMHRRALSILIRNYGDEHPKVAETLSLFGAWIPLTDIYEAARMREKSLEIYRAVYGDHHLKVALGYMDTGRIKRALALPDEAIKDFRKALDIRTSALGTDHPDVAKSMIFLGDVYRLYNINMDSAEVFYRDARQILQGGHESFQPGLLHVLGSYADLLSDKGDHRKAQNLLQRSLEIRQAVYGPDHPLTADGLNHLASEFYNQGNYQRAEELYRNGLDIKEKILGQDHLALAGLLRDLAKTLVALKKYNKAENYLRRALQIQRDKFEDQTVALTFASLADLKFQQGNLSEAEELYHQALSIYERYESLNHYDAIELQNNLNKLQLAMIKD